MKLRRLKREDVEFQYKPYEPPDLPKWSEMAKDEAWLKKVEARRLESANRWAWCVIQVLAKYKGFTGFSYIDGASYDSKEEFLETDLANVHEQYALDDLNAVIKAAFEDMPLE